MQRRSWPAYTPKKSTLVAEWVLDKIRSQMYTEGAKLPSEREIAQILGVSRLPVREALSALQILGIVETQPGSGTYVRKSTPPSSRQGELPHCLEFVSFSTGGNLTNQG